MKGGKILGILIIIALILSVAVVGYNAFTSKNVNDKNIVRTSEILDESDLNESFILDNNESTQTVNINIKQKVGGAKIKFVDNSSTIYNVTSKNDKNKTTTVTYNQTDNHLDVYIDSENADNTIVLSNKYNYTINGEFVAGGFDANLANNSKVDEMNINITAGGVDIKFNGGSLNTLNSKINTGGLNIVGEPNGETHVDSEIEVGGLNLQMNKSIADIFSDIEVGGINPGNYQHISENEYKGNQFDSSANRLIINSTIRLGGVNTQSFH